jgi:Xaa-Pro dipeptidase
MTVSSEISLDEFRSRMGLLRAEMEKRELTTFLINNKESIYYLTGTSYAQQERPFLILVTLDGRTEILVPKLESDHMRKIPDYFSIKTYREFPAPPGEGWLERLEDMLCEPGALGIEPSLPVVQARRLDKYNPSIASIVETLRLVKSAREVELIRRAARLSVRGTELLLSASRYGETIAAGLSARGRMMGEIAAEVPDFDYMATSVIMAVWAGKFSAEPHRIPQSGDMTADGPNVSISANRVNGYAAESERTFFTAPPSAMCRDLFAIMMEARAKAFSMARPGVAASDIDAAVNAIFLKNGVGQNLLHRTGHGFGLGGHEGPWIAEGSDDVLQENMLISIEPGLYIPDHGGYRHSDTMLITEMGCENLTPYPDSIEALTLVS